MRYYQVAGRSPCHLGNYVCCSYSPATQSRLLPVHSTRQNLKHYKEHLNNNINGKKCVINKLNCIKISRLGMLGKYWYRRGKDHPHLKILNVAPVETYRWCSIYLHNNFLSFSTDFNLDCSSCALFYCPYLHTSYLLHS